MKFSQVEFCGVLGSVMRRVRVEVCGEEGEEEKAKASERLLSVLRDSCAEPLLLHVRQPEELKVRFLQR